jgi:hypothetical protein
MDSTISIIGSVASIGSAIWAFIEAKKAKNAASEIKKYRSEIETRIESSSLQRIYEEIKRILYKVSSFGPSSNATSVRGKNAQDVAKEVEEFARILLESSVHFRDFYSKEAIRISCKSLPNLIKGLAEADSFNDKKKHGSEIYQIIESLLPIIKATCQNLTLKEPLN